jgi:hypothetical protein
MLASRDRNPKRKSMPTPISAAGTTHILSEWNGMPAVVSWPENAARRSGMANFITPVIRKSSPRKIRMAAAELLARV